MGASKKTVAGQHMYALFPCGKSRSENVSAKSLVES